MNKIFLTEYDSYNEIMNLINFAEKSASRLLGELYQLPASTELLHVQKKYYEKILLGVLSCTQQLKTEWIDIGLEPQKYFVNLPGLCNDFEILKKQIKDIQGTINSIQSNCLFVNPDGFLFQTTNCTRS